jgi:hypothetical protein
MASEQKEQTTLLYGTASVYDAVDISFNAKQ